MNKLSQITFAFCMLKICGTTHGETATDLFTKSS